ncbi:MAG: response regulator [Lutibacter sp.]
MNTIIPSKIVLNNANLIAVMANANGEITFVSPAAKIISGYASEELLGNFWWEKTYFNIDDQKQFKKEVIASLKNKATTQTKPYERRLKCKNGDFKWIEWRDSITAEGIYLSIGVDISSWKKKEENRRQSDLILKNIPSIVLVCNQNGNVEYVSESIKEILGFLPNEVLGDKWWIKMYPTINKAEEAKEAIYNFVYNNKKSFVDIFNQKIRTEFGDRWIGWNYSKSPNGTYIAIGSDITENIIRDIELKKAKEAAEESVKVKNDFLANMSHEIRTPLNAVIGFTDLLLETELTQEQREHLLTMKNSGEILLTLINNILDLSKLETEKLELEEIVFDLHQTLKDVIKLMQVKANEKKLPLKLEISENTPVNLMGDPNRISQILLNLIGNAIKFTDKGLVSVWVDAEPVYKNICTVSIKVKDTGVGIVSNKINSVFGAFTQAKSDTSRIYGGTGLGLTIVKRLVKLFGGEVKVSSIFGKGSEFTVILPLRIAEESQKQDKVYLAENDINDSLGYHILLVEDNKTNQLLAKARLERWGCTVDIANNGFEGVKKTQNNLYDVILMDVQMPVMDGYEATKIIKNDISAEVSKIPIIAMTAFTSKTEVQRALNSGMDAYVFKPFKPDELYTILKEQVNKVPVVEKKVKNIEKPIKNEPTFKYLNLAYIKEESLGEKSVMILLCELFFKDLKEYMGLLAENVSIEKWEVLYKATHKIKPSIGMFGITKLSPIILQLESLFKEEKDKAEIKKLVRKCKNIIVFVKEELKVELKFLKDE